MAQLATGRYPRVPVSADELDGWLERRAEELWANFPQSIVRVSRMRQGRVANVDVGWLIELDLDEEALAEDSLADVLRDMRLLGLPPTLLTPRGAAANGRGA
jgi:hypothetical protein